MRVAVVILLCMLTGCTTVLYDGKNNVSILLQGEPRVGKDNYEIHFQFESPTDDPHLIQWVDFGEYRGVEAFRTLNGRSGIDCHVANGVVYQHRRMVVAPGLVEYVDESIGGFSMLPSEWPEHFNAWHRQRYGIRGRVNYRRHEKQTIYHLEFNNGKLVWWIEGSNIRREWGAK